MPEIAACDMPIYLAWLEADREPMGGSLTLSGLLQVYDLHGLHDLDPLEFRNLMRAMQAADKEEAKKSG